VLDEALGVGAGLVELAHVAQDADGPDDLAVGVAESGGVEGRGDALTAHAARVQDHVPHHPPFDYFAKRRRELPRLLGADEAGERLLEHLVLPEPEELGHRIVVSNHCASPGQSETDSGNWELTAGEVSVRPANPENFCGDYAARRSSAQSLVPNRSTRWTVVSS